MFGFGGYGCASTPTSGLTESELQVQRLSVLAEIEQRREEIKPQLADKELHWFATAQVEKAKASWNQAEEQYLLVAESPERLSQRLGVFNSRARGVVIDTALNDAIEALNRANVIRAEAQVVLSEAFSNDEVLKQLEVTEDLHDNSISDQAGIIHEHLLALQEEQPETVMLREELAESASELANTLEKLEAVQTELNGALETSAGYATLVEALQVERDELPAALEQATEELAKAEEALLEEELLEEEVLAEEDEVITEDETAAEW